MTELIHDTVAKLIYKPGWRFVLANISMSMSYYLQVEFTCDGEVWRGRKWLLSQHMTEGEVVQTALMACLAAEENEAREAFSYKGKALFGPHIGVEALLSVADEVVVRS